MGLVGGLALGSAQWISQLDQRLEVELERPLYTQPTALFARPLELRPGADLERLRLLDHLERTGYREVSHSDPGALAKGEFIRSPTNWTIARRDFPVATSIGDAPTALLSGRLGIETDRRGRVRHLRDGSRQALDRAWIEPVRLGVVRSTDVVQDREILPLERVPAPLVDAIVVAEDRRFFEHTGVDPRRIAAAALANFREGEITQGGSTLTQQLVKNLYVGRERSLTRKVREAALSVLLERRRTKEEILEAYLNEIYLGQDGGTAIHGVARASRHYFGRPADELDVASAATIAAIIPGPVLYDPFRNPELVVERRNWVLGEMMREGRLDRPSFEKAVESPLVLRPPRTTLRSVAYFTDHLRKELDASDPEWASPGHSIVTTLDWRLQSIAEHAIDEGLEALEEENESLRREDAPLQASLVALDPRTGELLALVGGRRYSASQFNRATQATRQPGSVFKPIVALAALGRERSGVAPEFTLASMLEDEPLLVPSDKPDEEDWEPENYDSEFRGPVTLRHAFEHSLNVPVARLAQDLGLRRVVRAARRLGLRSRLRAVPSLPLGTFEVTLLDMTSVYGVFAARGKRAEPRSLLYSIDAAGAAHAAGGEAARWAISEDEAYLVSALLRGVVENGTARALPAYGYSGTAVGKTGTTNDYRDAWFIGYTPELVVGVWVGFDDGQSVNGTGSERAMPIFAAFMRDTLGPRGGSKFRRPRSIESESVIAVVNEPAGLACRDADAYEEIFLSGSGPRADCRFGLARAFFPHRGANRHDPYDPRAGRDHEVDPSLPEVGAQKRRRPSFFDLFEEVLGRRKRR